MPAGRTAGVGEDLPHQEYSRGKQMQAIPMTLRGAEKLREELIF